MNLVNIAPQEQTRENIHMLIERLAELNKEVPLHTVFWVARGADGLTRVDSYGCEMLADQLGTLEILKMDLLRQHGAT